MIYILILIISTSQTAAIHSIEFNSYEACEVARKKVAHLYNRGSMECVEKGILN